MADVLIIDGRIAEVERPSTPRVTPTRSTHASAGSDRASSTCTRTCENRARESRRDD